MDHQPGPAPSSILPNLLWVSEQDGAGKTKARSHAMREWRRVKKGKKAAALRQSAANSARFSSWVKADLPLTPPSSGEDKEATPEEEGSSKESQLVPPARKICYECGPLSVLGAGRRNPYLAVDLGQEGDLLLDRCMFSMSRLMSGFSMKAKFNPLRDLIWSTTIEDPTGSALQGAIALSACQTDMIFGGRLGHETISHLLKAMRTVSDNLASVSDSLIFAVSFLASFEFWAGNHKSCLRHLDGMARMIDRRGGFIELGPELQMMLLWTFLVTPDRLVPYSPTTPATIAHDPERSNAELFGFFNGIQMLSSKPKSPYQAVTFAFKPGTTLFALLSTPTAPGKLQPAQPVSRVSLVRLAAVIYIHLTLLEMPRDVFSWREYGKDIQERLLDHFADIEIKSNTMMSYIWLLMKADDRIALENPFRAWFTARMLKVIMAVLKPASLEKITDLLLGYLMGLTYTRSERDLLLGLETAGGGLEPSAKDAEPSYRTSYQK